MKLFDWFRSRQPRGIHSGEAAAEWARCRFPPEFRPIAAYVADLLCEQLGVNLSSIEPATAFTTDLRMDELEPVEVVMALDEDLGVSIPDKDCAQLMTVADLVKYLHERISSKSRNS